jgi:adenine-specific DNA-methyltransferase
LKFSSVKIISIQERYFNEAGTEEKTAILTCEGFNLERGEVQKTQANRLSEALQLVNEEKLEQKKQEFPVYDLRCSFKKVEFKTIFSIKIGIVIGATKLLTYNAQQVVSSKYYPEFTYPIITKGRILNNIKINRDSLIANRQMPIYLIDGINMELKNPQLFNELLNSIPSSVLINETFSNREKLFGYDDYKHPDAFLTFYSQKNPRLILNEDKELNCTNSVHRIYLQSEYEGQTWLVKFVILQLFAGLYHDEILSKARQYGDRIKKYEPSDAGQIPIIISTDPTPKFINAVENLFDQVYTLLAIGESKDAENMVNIFLNEIVIVSNKSELFVA